MPENQILILSKDASRYLELIQSQVRNVKAVACHSVNEAQAYIDTATILLAEPALALPILNDLKKLAWFQSTWAGIRPLLGSDFRRDYRLTGVKHIFGPLMSEYVFCYVLLHERNVLEHLEFQKEKLWHYVMPGRLTGKVMGIFGTGSIGSHLAQTARHFGVSIKGFNRSGLSQPSFDEVVSGDVLTFVKDLDYLVCTLPDTPASHHLIDAKVLAAMKNTALLINVGRGNTVDEKALVLALQQRHIAAAVLDVFQQEPLPSDHPLWAAPNIIISSHTAAPSFAEDIAEIFIENHHNFVAGKDLNYLIDFERGY